MTDRPAPGYTPARGEAKFPDLTLHKLDWAVTQNNLGRALYLLGERKQARKLFEEAREAYRAALEVLESAGELRYREMARNNLDEVTRRLQESGSRPSVQE